jgi:hypothetical protein
MSACEPPPSEGPFHEVCLISLAWGVYGPRIQYSRHWHHTQNLLASPNKHSKTVKVVQDPAGAQSGCLGQQICLRLPRWHKVPRAPSGSSRPRPPAGPTARSPKPPRAGVQIWASAICAAEFKMKFERVHHSMEKIK